MMLLLEQLTAGTEAASARRDKIRRLPCGHYVSYAN
jgi:hypothetical protein|eukprot:COSAG01_NODE_3389_length_6151_cov_375.493225_4_plen_36_part_00